RLLQHRRILFLRRELHGRQQSRRRRGLSGRRGSVDPRQRRRRRKGGRPLEKAVESIDLNRPPCESKRKPFWEDSMRKLTTTLAPLLLTAVVAVPAAHAQATRTWVSGVGDDANPCSRTAPCKTFAGAISKTAAGGEISVLDPGGFGVVTITKSITISGDGTL